VTTIERRSSPFDSIRYEDDDGEYWYARELMILMGYSLWRHFNTAINRAKTSMANDSGDYDVRDHFAVVKRPAEVNVGKTTQTPDQGGRPSLDYRLSRDGCYFIALNGDPKKEQVALAQQYFVAQTLRMEAVEQALQAPLTAPVGPPGMPTYPEALRGWADALEAQQRAERLVEVLRPPAEAWNALAAAGGDCAIAEAANILNRADGVSTGPTRLSRWLMEMRVLYRRPGGQLVPYSAHAEHIRLRPSRSGSSEVRITPAGLSWILQRMRQEQQRPALTVVPESRADMVPIRRS
jgi:DNA-damage-inducible protein D